MPLLTDSKLRISQVALHECTHAYQVSRGGPRPYYMIEGGATFNQCLFISQIDPNDSFSNCMKKIIRATRALYASNPNVKWLSSYANDRCDQMTSAQFRRVYYDLGAFVIVFLLHRSSVSPSTFWTLNSGFWNYPGIVYDSFAADGIANEGSYSVPEFQGWKAAISNMLNGETVADFYQAFEEYMVDNITKKVVSESDMFSILMDDDYVHKESLIAPDFNAVEYDSSARSPGECKNTGFFLTFPFV